MYNVVVQELWNLSEQKNGLPLVVVVCEFEFKFACKAVNFDFTMISIVGGRLVKLLDSLASIVNY